MTLGGFDKLRRSWAASNSILCVGIDPDPAKLPAALVDQPDGIVGFCTAIIDATAEAACAFKPQIAHFGRFGDHPMSQRQHLPPRTSTAHAATKADRRVDQRFQIEPVTASSTSPRFATCIIAGLLAGTPLDARTRRS